MNILLLHPEAPDTFWGFRYALRFIAKRSAQPPLGLLTVAALLPKDWNLRLVDMNVQRLKNRDLDWADYVFVSAMAVQKISVRQVVDRCKNRGRTIVAGGPLFSTEPELFPDVDHILQGEAELTIPRFLEDMASGRLKREYKAGGYANVESTPHPRWDLVKMKHYAQMSLQYSRGCPYDCEFCDIGVLFGRGVRTKSGDQMVRELEMLHIAGWRGEVFLVDDNFIGNRGKLRGDILPAVTNWMKYRDYPFSFGTEASINLADDKDLMAKMVKAGFNSVFVGIESVNDSALSECNKNHNRNRDMLQSVRALQQSGLVVKAGFILGFDSDKPSVFESTCEFIQQSGIANAMVGLLNAPRDTRLYRRMKRENRLLNDGQGDNTDGTVNFLPSMGMETLVKGYREVIQRLYSPKAYYDRVRTFLEQYRPAPMKSLRLKPSYLWAVAGSVVRLGVFGRERRQFWSLMSWSFFHRQRVLPMAVTLAIHGFHFRMYFEVE